MRNVTFYLDENGQIERIEIATDTEGDEQIVFGFVRSIHSATVGWLKSRIN
jgi:hypothetical protein